MSGPLGWLGRLLDIYVVSRSQLTCTRRLSTTYAPLLGRIGSILHPPHCHATVFASLSARYEPASAACLNIIQFVQAKWLLLPRTNLDIALPEVGKPAVEGRQDEQDEVRPTRAPERASRGAFRWLPAMRSNISHSTYIVRLRGMHYTGMVGYLTEPDCLSYRSRHVRLYLGSARLPSPAFLSMLWRRVWPR